MVEPSTSEIKLPGSFTPAVGQALSKQGLQAHESPTVSETMLITYYNKDFEKFMDIRDAKENRRREQAQWFIVRRVQREQAKARAEEESRIALFDQETQRLREQKQHQLRKKNEGIPGHLR